MLSQNRFGGCANLIPMSRRNVSQVIYVIVEVIDRYSASELEWDTVGCFFEHQDMRFARKNERNNVVLLWVIGQRAQSASLKA